MTTPKPIRSSGAPEAYESISPAEKLEKDALLAGEVAAGALRGVEVAAVVLLGLLVCPPLAILVVLVVVPLLVLGLLVAVLSTPYLLVHHFRGHHDHLSLLANRLRRAGRAFIDLLPHRVVADARKVGSGR
jgi:hypothetical protein